MSPRRAAIAAREAQVDDQPWFGVLADAVEFFVLAKALPHAVARVVAVRENGHRANLGRRHRKGTHTQARGVAMGETASLSTPQDNAGAGSLLCVSADGTETTPR